MGLSGRVSFRGSIPGKFAVWYAENMFINRYRLRGGKEMRDLGRREMGGIRGQRKRGGWKKKEHDSAHASSVTFNGKLWLQITRHVLRHGALWSGTTLDNDDISPCFGENLKLRHALSKTSEKLRSARTATSNELCETCSRLALTKFREHLFFSISRNCISRMY